LGLGRILRGAFGGSRKTENGRIDKMPENIFKELNMTDDEIIEREVASFDVERELAKIPFRDNDIESDLIYFTGQKAGDMDIEQLCKAGQEAGVSGLELVTWGEGGFDVLRALSEDPRDDKKSTGRAYVKEYIEVLDKYNMSAKVLGDHLATQALFANVIDLDLLNILPPDCKGSKAFEVNYKVAEHMKNVARATKVFREVAAEMFDGDDKKIAKYDLKTVTGFIGSPIWDKLYGFPPANSMDTVELAFQVAGERLRDIMGVFDENDVDFGLEVHPTEQAMDTYSALKLITETNHKRFGANNDASHFVYQGVDEVEFVEQMNNGGLTITYHDDGTYTIALMGQDAKRKDSDKVETYHAVKASHMKDMAYKIRTARGQKEVSGVFGGHLPMHHPLAYMAFHSIGRNGAVRNAEVMYALAASGYKGDLSIEWEDGQFKFGPGLKASRMLLEAIKDNNPDLARQGLKMYKNPDNYKIEPFDAGFKKQRRA